MTTCKLMRTIGWCAAASLVLMSAPAAAEHPYLNDANSGRTPQTDGSVPPLQHDYPRVHSHEMFGGSVEAYSKYQLITAHGTHFSSIERIQQQYSADTMALRHISGRAYQSYNYSHCVISGGVAFEATTASSQGGPSSAGCGIYAGHWLYRSGTRLRQSIGASATSLAVENASRIDAGQYVVIYDAPAGSFNNAEHARVVSVNRSANTIEVQRGYKSSSVNHPSGAIVSQHVLGQGTDPKLWAFNMSTQSPRDASNRTFPQFYAEWLGRNLDRYNNGTRTSANIAGILFDADFYNEYTRYEVDADNNLVVDDAVGPNGENWLGDGLDDFYARVKNQLTGYYVLVGVHHGRGFDSAHGLQMENWLDYGNGDFTPNPVYEKLSSMIAGYLFNSQERSNGPALVTNLTKTPTKFYPGDSNNVPSNAPFRLALTTALIQGGYFGTHSALTPDPWWDEFAVDVRPGSANFGKAISKSNVSAIHEHRGWLGKPLGPFKRVYADADFTASRSMIGNNTFDSNLTGWDSKNVSISRVSSNTMDGSGAMYVSRLNSTSGGEFGASVNGEQVNVTRNVPYTLAFSARASDIRELKISLGNDSFPVAIGPNWRRYVVTLNPTSTSSTRLKFIVGGENTELWFDSVYLFEGDANVFRRDFEHGVALSNATAQSRTIQVGSGLRRISGTQDPTVNNGARVTSVTLPPYDGIVLVREDGQTGPDPEPDPDPPTSGNAAIGDYVWRDSDGDGIQDNGESGVGGVTVQLRECNGILLASTTTSGNGSYLFDNLSSGGYLIRFVAPNGASFTQRKAGSDAGKDSNADSSGNAHCVTVGVNDTRQWIDAGLVY